MKRYTILAFLLFSIVFNCISQENSERKSKYGISFEMDMITHFDDLDQEGIGVGLAIGGVKHLGDSGHYRLIPSVEYGSFQWQENDVLNTYFSLNLLAQMDLIRSNGIYSLPISGGLVFDYSKNGLEDSRVKEAYKFYLGNRLNFKGNWAVEFLNIGLTFNKEFLSIKVGIIRVERKF